MTQEEYLEIERHAETKSEFYQGEMFAMAGAGWGHNLVVGNLVFQFNEQLRRRPCFVCPSDMRVRVSATGLYTYPDVIVLCEPPQFLDGREDTLLNPGLIVEVLSPSTEAYDRGRKFEHYRSLASLREYLLVDSTRMSADLYRRQADGGWLLTAFSQPEDVLDLQAPRCQLALADLYRKVELNSAIGLQLFP